MALAKKFTLLAVVLALGLVLATGALAAMEKAELINGTHWTKWPQQDKLVYIRGLTNWADFIAASTRGRTYEGCISKALADELKSKTLGQISAEVDAFYKVNPGKMDTSVIEVVIRECTKLCQPQAGAKERKK
jgi:hypothetical protein